MAKLGETDDSKTVLEQMADGKLLFWLRSAEGKTYTSGFKGLLRMADDAQKFRLRTGLIVEVL